MAIEGPSEPEEVARQLVLEHAAVCFETYGIHRTRMADIADRAGLSRRALYRIFPNRQAIVDEVLIARAKKLIEALVPTVLGCTTFAEAVLEGSVQSIALTRRSPDLLRLSVQGNLEQAGRVMLRSDAAVLHLSQDFWQPVIDRGRARGEVRPDLDDNEFIEWMTTINFMYAMRVDVPLDRIRTLLRRLLVPAAVAGAEKLLDA
jgi:AcrR family transcriptional regulator